MNEGASAASAFDDWREMRDSVPERRARLEEGQPPMTEDKPPNRGADAVASLEPSFPTAPPGTVAPTPRPFSWQAHLDRDVEVMTPQGPGMIDIGSLHIYTEWGSFVLRAANADVWRGLRASVDSLAEAQGHLEAEAAAKPHIELVKGPAAAVPMSPEQLAEIRKRSGA